MEEKFRREGLQKQEKRRKRERKARIKRVLKLIGTWSW